MIWYISENCLACDLSSDRHGASRYTSLAPRVENRTENPRKVQKPIHKRKDEIRARHFRLKVRVRKVGLTTTTCINCAQRAERADQERRRGTLGLIKPPERPERTSGWAEVFAGHSEMSSSQPDGETNRCKTATAGTMESNALCLLSSRSHAVRAIAYAPKANSTRASVHAKPEIRHGRPSAVSHG